MLRIACTRQRCQVEPWKQRPMALTRPACASEMTSFTPVSPRALRSPRNSVQNVSFSESPTSTPSTSRRPSWRSPVAITTALDTTWRCSRTWT